ncbi:MAG: response regulator [bacterium]
MIDILLVEDNPADVELIRECLENSRFVASIQVRENGGEALSFLTGEQPVAGAEVQPGLIMLDLNLPGLNGRQVLEELKSDVLLKRIPVIVLSSSDAEQDVADSYELGASSYIVKPADFSGYATLARALEDFWGRVVKLPVPGHEPV